ncbi:MAG: TIGR03118 family protein [Acidobacteria bacterium]|nr:TIGR03118 family protein [Acidobacteriota bacterium]
MQRLRFALIFSLGLVLTSFSGTASAQYKLTNLDSNQFRHAQMDDPLIVNAWGMARSPTSPWWISDTGSGWSTIYDGAGVKNTGLVVAIPAAAGVPVGSPTGMVWNPSATGEFQGAPFIFDSLDGTITAWEPGVSRFSAQLIVDNSANKASYTALAITNKPSGNFLYAVDNTNNRVEIYDGTFTLMGTFAADPAIPSNFSAFGIRDINGVVYVSYADVNLGPGGFIDTFNEDGTLIGTFAQGFGLNQPWGFAMAPADFGRFSNMLLISNNNDRGTIVAFNAQGQFVGTLRQFGLPLIIDQLWAIDFGGGSTANGPTNTLYFTAGPHDNLAGTFGMIVAAGSNQNQQSGNIQH